MAIVGARRATPTALEVARALGRALAAAGVTVVSGMALGIDGAAHAGALEVGRADASPCSPAAPTCRIRRSKRGLYRAIVADAARRLGAAARLRAVQVGLSRRATGSSPGLAR